MEYDPVKYKRDCNFGIDRLRRVLIIIQLGYDANADPQWQFSPFLPRVAGYIRATVKANNVVWSPFLPYFNDMNGYVGLNVK
jgi:hypothetical protein